MTNVFVRPERLSESHTDLSVVDVRDESAYREGHVPGAVCVPFEAFRNPTDETPGMLPRADEFASLLRRAGVATDDRIVAYDDEFGVSASRFLVTAEVFGHPADRLHLVDGDYTAWRRDHGASTSVPAVRRTDYECAPPGDPLIDADQLEAARETGATVVDTRDPIEYETVHVPGAVNFQWRALVDEDDRRLEPRERCLSVLSGCGVTLDRPVRLYCNTARRLSFVYTVLRELGHGDAAIYEGGILEWADRGGRLETTT